MRVYREQAGKDSLIAHQASAQGTGNRYERLVLLPVRNATALQWLKRPDLPFPFSQTREE
jgi:hypothetical protein